MTYRRFLYGLAFMTLISCVTGVLRFEESKAPNAATIVVAGTPANYGIYIESGSCFSRRIWPQNVRPDIVDFNAINPETTKLRVEPDQPILYTFQGISPVSSTDPSVLIRKFCEGGVLLTPESGSAYVLTFHGRSECKVTVATTNDKEVLQARIFRSSAEIFGPQSDIKICN